MSLWMPAGMDDGIVPVTVTMLAMVSDPFAWVSVPATARPALPA
jgi:hypothetical protein